MLENYTVIDLEMTGLNAKTDAILEVGAVRVRDGQISDTYCALLRTDRSLTEKVKELTGITEDMIQNGENPETAMADFFSFVGEDVLVGQNLIFDYRFLKQWAVNHKFSFEREAVDTLKLARRFLPPEQKKDLESLCQYFGVERERAHRALEDAIETYRVFEKLKEAYIGAGEEAFIPHPLLYKTKKQTPATGRQIAYLKKFASYYGVELPKTMGAMTRSEASRLTDRLIAQYGKLPKLPECEQ